MGYVLAEIQLKNPRLPKLSHVELHNVASVKKG